MFGGHKSYATQAIFYELQYEFERVICLLKDGVKEGESLNSFSLFIIISYEYDF